MLRRITRALNAPSRKSRPFRPHFPPCHVRRKSFRFDIWFLCWPAMAEITQTEKGSNYREFLAVFSRQHFRPSRFCCDVFRFRVVYCCVHFTFRLWLLCHAGLSFDPIRTRKDSRPLGRWSGEWKFWQICRKAEAIQLGHTDRITARMLASTTKKSKTTHSSSLKINNKN